MKFLKQATYIRYVLAKLSKSAQITTQTSSDFFFTKDYLKIKRVWNQFPGHIFYRIIL